MPSRRHTLSLLAALPLAACFRSQSAPPKALRVGLLTSRTGQMASDEAGVLEALQFAIDEINATPAEHKHWALEPILGDGGSDAATFAREAGRLLDEGAVALFGCWTSSSRKAVLPVLDEKSGFLVYPLQYEGLEQHPRVLYTGSTPNQQILPAVRWAVSNLGDRFFLVGSDYVFPRVANALIRDELLALGLDAVGEAYLPAKADDATFAAQARDIAARIRDVGATVVLNTLNGRGGNLALFRALRAVGLGPAQCPTVSFSIAERSFRTLEDAQIDVRGDYAMWGYLDALSDQENTKLKHAFSAWRSQKGRSGDDAHNDPMISARAGLHLWFRAIRTLGEGGWADLPRLQQALRNRTLVGPGGVMHVDDKNQHTWRHARLGRVEKGGKLVQIWSSPLPIHPQPFPSYRSRDAWQALLRTYDAPSG